ncbi:MAG TPA: MerR family transcriptional regulator [Polyangiaceae bacterium]|nr:MerR family transcriptional regulator [Polyangiaceae bacterium]
MDESTLSRIEREHAVGLTSAEILDLFAQGGVHLTEATLRKYVQLGLLPRSVRVGRKGKHQGSQGVYPVTVVRQILRIKEMMADNYTIEQIKRDVLFMRSDIQALETTLENIFQTLSRVMKERRGEAQAQAVVRDVEGARALSRDLIQRLGAIESRLSARPSLRRVSVS